MTSSWSEGRVVADGSDVFYRRSHGSGPVIVAAHGLTDDGACWSRLARALEHQADVVMYDARGHGASARSGSYAFDDQVSDLLVLVRALGLESPILLGHSMGGAHVAAAAAREPRLPAAVILEDPHWPLARECADAYDLDAWAARLDAARALPADVLLARGRREHPTWHEDDLRPWAEAQRRVDPAVVTWLRSEREIARWPRSLRAVRCPVLVITGDHDVSVTPAVSAIAAERSPQLEVITVRSAGHSVRRDRFAAYLATVRAFLADQCAASETVDNRRSMPA